MGKGQKLRRDAAVPLNAGPAVAAPVSVAPGRAQSAAQTTAIRPAGAPETSNPPPAASTRRLDSGSIGGLSSAGASQQLAAAPATSVVSSLFSDGPDAYLTMPDVERMAIIDSLFARVEVEVQDMAASSSKPLRSSQSMEGLASQMGSARIASDASAKGYRSSSSLQDLGSSSAPSITSAAALDLAAIVRHSGLASVDSDRVISLTREHVAEDGRACECGLLILKCLLFNLEKAVEAYVCPLIPRLLALNADKSALIRDSSAEILTRFSELVCPYAVFSLYDFMSEAMTEANDWKIRVAALQLLKGVAPRVTGLISPLLPRIIPEVRSQCQAAAVDATSHMPV
jgi:hypothetical protein